MGVTPSPIANEDIVAAADVRAACLITDGSVATTRGVFMKGIATNGGVIIARVVCESTFAKGGITHSIIYPFHF